MHNIFGILCFIVLRNVKTQLKLRKKKICALNGEGAVTDWMCQKWFVKFLGTVDVLAKLLFDMHWEMCGGIPGSYQ